MICIVAGGVSQRGRRIRLSIATLKKRPSPRHLAKMMLILLELDAHAAVMGGGDDQEEDEEAEPSRVGKMLRAIKANDMGLLQKMVGEDPGLVTAVDEKKSGGMSGLMGAARIRR